MRVAVTGGTGCLGRPLAEKLIAGGAHPKLLVLPNDPSITFLTQKAEIVVGNLNSPDAMDKLCIDCDIVFHLAGMVHLAPGTKEEEEEFFWVNVEGTRNLLAAAKKSRVKRVVFYSTVGAYGKDADFHGDELSPCQPLTAYAKSKYQADYKKQVLDNGAVMVSFILISTREHKIVKDGKLYKFVSYQTGHQEILDQMVSTLKFTDKE